MADFPQRSLKASVLSFFVLVVCSSMSGCGNGKDYQVPDSLCGVPVDPDLVDPLLSSGKEIRQDSEESQYVDACAVWVDDKSPLYIEGEWRSAEITALEVAKENRAHYATPFPDREYAAWPEGASAVLECRNSEEKAKYYSIVAETTEGDDREASKEAMKRFIVAYAEEFAKTLPCEGQ